MLLLSLFHLCTSSSVILGEALWSNAIYVCAGGTLLGLSLFLTHQKKFCSTKKSNWPFQLSPIHFGRSWGFLSALNIFHFSTEKFLPTIFVPQSHTISISNCHSLGYNQYSCILPSILYQRAATAPTFQWELPNIFSHSFISSRIFSAEIIDARQPMPA